jgi:hypothetical protein
MWVAEMIYELLNVSRPAENLSYWGATTAGEGLHIAPAFFSRWVLSLVSICCATGLLLNAILSAKEQSLLILLCKFDAAMV